MLLRVLEEIYLEALLRPVDMGYDMDTALKAVTRSRHCYGDEDVLLNIFNNALSYLTGDCRSRNPIFEVDGIVLTSWTHTVEHSLGCMVHALQQIHHSRRMAMFSLLFGKFNMSAAIALPASDDENCESDSSNKNATNVDLPPCCSFNHCVGIRWLRDSDISLNRSADSDERNNHRANDEEHLQRYIEVPERFGLSPELKSMQKKNVPKIAAAVRANSMHLLAQTFMPSNASVKGDAPAVLQPEICDESSVLGYKGRVSSVVDGLCCELSNLNLDGNLVDLPEDRKDAIILHLQNQIEDYERQVKEREAWARQKAIQAEKSVDKALLELESLRKEMTESRVLKKGKPTLDLSTVMKLSEKESALRKVGAQAEAAHAAMENENAEIRAQIESFNQSASESDRAYLEIAMREKKNLKKILRCERQKDKLQEEIAEQNQKISDLQQQLVDRASHEGS